jgi:hypothetical protein
MAISIAQIDNALNSARDTALSSISSASGNVQLQSIFLVVAVLMALMIIMEFRKGREERKGIWGPLGILIFCGSVLFNFRIVAIAWILLFYMGTVLGARLKQGEIRGILVVLVAMYGLAFIISVNTYMMMGIIGVTSVLGFVIRKENIEKIFGRKDAQRAASEAGMPVTRERRLLKMLRRISTKGYRWTKDGIVRSAAKIKQRFAERALRNEAEQQREAEIVAVGEKISKTLDAEEDAVAQAELRDGRAIEEIMQRCTYLESHLNGLPPGKLEADAEKYITTSVHQILELAHQLVKDKIAEESMMEKANRIFESSMNIIHHSAHETTMLEDHKADFKEMKSAAMTNIKAMKKVIEEEKGELKRAINEQEHSKAEGADTRVHLMNNRLSGLASLAAKLEEVEKYVIQVDEVLVRITVKEDKKVEEVKDISKKAERHSDLLQHYSKGFKEDRKKLTRQEKKFEHLFSKGEGSVAIVELSTATDGTIELLQTLDAMASLIAEYHEKELLPMMQELAQIAQSIAHLAKVSEDLTKVYFRMSQANEALTKLAAEVDKNPESKKQLQEIWQAEDFEEKVIRKAYRGGRAVVSHIGEGYRHLQRAYALSKDNTQRLRSEESRIKDAHAKIRNSLSKAFDRLMKKEEKQLKAEQKDAGEAYKEAKRAEWSEAAAKRQERAA